MVPGDFPNNCKFCGGSLDKTSIGRTYTGGVPKLCICGNDYGYNLYGDLPTQSAKLLSEFDIAKQKEKEIDQKIKDTQYYDLVNDLHNICEKYKLKLMNCSVDNYEKDMSLILIAKIDLANLYKKEKNTEREIL